jgi:hypothetical protein
MYIQTTQGPNLTFCTENSVSKCFSCGTVLVLLNMFAYVCVHISVNLLDHYTLVSL